MGPTKTQTPLLHGFVNKKRFETRLLCPKMCVFGQKRFVWRILPKTTFCPCGKSKNVLICFDWAFGPKKKGVFFASKTKQRFLPLKNNKTVFLQRFQAVF